MVSNLYSQFMRNIIIVISLILLASCNSHPPCPITKDDLLENNKGLVYAIDSTNPNSDYWDVGPDSVRGGHYSFYKDGKLKEYKFFTSKDVSNYSEKYDSSGRLTKLTGEPLVHKGAGLSGDSMILRYYLLTLNRNYKSITFSMPGQKDTLLQLQRDSSFSNVSVVRYVVKDLGTEKNIKGVFKIDYENRCEPKDSRILLDSLNLQYKQN